jgi:hypothetical protein
MSKKMSKKCQKNVKKMSKKVEKNVKKFLQLTDLRGHLVEKPQECLIGITKTRWVESLSKSQKKKSKSLESPKKVRKSHEKKSKRCRRKPRPSNILKIL